MSAHIAELAGLMQFIKADVPVTRLRHLRTLCNSQQKVAVLCTIK